MTNGSRTAIIRKLFRRYLNAGPHGGITQLVEYPVHTRYVICSSQIAATRPVGQAVKTPPFHGGNMGSIPVRVTMKRLPTPKGVGSLFISGLPVRGSLGCPRCQFCTVIFSKSLLPLQCPVSLPGGNRCKDPSPPCQRGVVLPMAKPGGFRRLAGFHMSLYFLKSADCESLSQKSKIFASSLWQGSLLGAVSIPGGAGQ